ncbi:hypothetical protein ACFY4C_28765 [Actinomadura viridis]|uniref:hypothetical protein n=1 Tax=Actinomadura viridis TaxID=58110 RepID=UPI003695909E
MRTLKFRALVTIDPAAARTWDLSSTIRHLVVRVQREVPAGHRHFSAMLSTDDQNPLLPGDTDHVVTMAIVDESAAEVLTPGERFDLWGRGKVGHGVVSRRVFM